MASAAAASAAAMPSPPSPSMSSEPRSSSEFPTSSDWAPSSPTRTRGTAPSVGPPPRAMARQNDARSASSSISSTKLPSQCSQMISPSAARATRTSAVHVWQKKRAVAA